MDGLSENVDGTTHALSDFDVTRKVLSFGYFSLLAPAVLALRAGFAVRAFGAVHQQRKVTRRQAKALLLKDAPLTLRNPATTSLGPRLRGDEEPLSASPFAA
jgi:hypothetical protein